MREWIANYCDFPRFMKQMLNFRAGFFRVPGGHLLKVWWHRLVNKNTHSDNQVFSTVTVAEKALLQWQEVLAPSSWRQLVFYLLRHMHMKRQEPWGCNVFTKTANHSVISPTPISITQHKPGAYDLICRSIPFWSEPECEICLVSCCRSDYWGDTDRLSWSGMRACGMRQLYNRCHESSLKNTHTFTEKWATSRSLCFSSDPCNRVQCMCMLNVSYLVQQSDWVHH